LLEFINNRKKRTMYAFLLHAQLFTLSPFLEFPRRRLTSPSTRFRLRRERIGICTSSSVTINPYRAATSFTLIYRVADFRQHSVLLRMTRPRNTHLYKIFGRIATHIYDCGPLNAFKRSECYAPIGNTNVKPVSD